MYIFSAQKWLELAQRSDLMDKPINTIIKYFMCSEHFTDDCFVDPQTRNKLKKSIRPFFVPLPSIFQCNIEQYIRSDKPVFDSHPENAIEANSPQKYIDSPPPQTDKEDLYEQVIDHSMSAEENDFIYVTPIEKDVECDDIQNGPQHYIMHSGTSDQNVLENELHFSATEDDNNQSMIVTLSDMHENDNNKIEDEMLVLVEEPSTELELQARESKEKEFECMCRLCAEVFASNFEMLRIYGQDRSLEENLQLLLNDVVSVRIMYLSKVID